MATIGPTVRRAIALTAWLLLARTAMAAQAQRLSGKKLLIKNPPSGAAGNKIVHLSKDTSIVPGAGTVSWIRGAPRNGGGTSSLQIIASGGAGAGPSHFHAPDGPGPASYLATQCTNTRILRALPVTSSS